MTLFWLSFFFFFFFFAWGGWVGGEGSFPLNNFWRDALISFKLCRTLYHCKIQVKFDIGNQSPNFGWVMALFRLSFCCCVDSGFLSITYAGMHWFYWKFAGGYIIVKYRSSSILVIIRKILAELWPFSTLFLLVFSYWFPLNNFCRDALILLKVCRRIYYCKIQAKLDICNYPQNFGQVMALFFCLSRF